ncbi:hypothetical protein Vi05172_g2041 [Venturia inaequalis]|nr:hypothetical protein Vi05172_g2041 [Venturia inaequalis]
MTHKERDNPEAKQGILDTSPGARGVGHDPVSFPSQSHYLNTNTNVDTNECASNGL